MSYTRYIYTEVHWKNKSESLETPLGKTRLNHMDSGIYNIAENLDIAYNELNAGKFEKADAKKVITEMPTYNEKTGVLTFKFYDGTQFSVDFNVEKIPVSFSMDSAGVITMKTSDGTEWTANIGDVIPTYTFTDTDTISITDTKNGDYSHTISATVKKGSIKGEHLQPDYLADVTSQATKADASASLAKQYEENAAYDAKLAQSYAVGQSGIRQGEDTDNAKKYKDDCQQIYNTMQQSGILTGVIKQIDAVAFADLPELTSVTFGDMYIVTDIFYTDNKFKEGAGIRMAAGTSVYKTKDGYWTCMSGAAYTTVLPIDPNTEPTEPGAIWISTV